MLRVDKRSNAAGLLRLGNGVYCKRGLTTTLRSVNLDNPSARITAHAQCGVKADAARWYYLDCLDALVAEFHYRALAEVLFYFGHGSLKGFQFALLHAHALSIFFFCHILNYVSGIKDVNTLKYEL